MTEGMDLDCVGKKYGHQCGENNWELISDPKTATVIATCCHCGHTMNIIVRISIRNVER